MTGIVVSRDLDDLEDVSASSPLTGQSLVVEGTMPNTLDDVDYWTDGVVTLTLYNNTGGAIDLASSTWYVQARKRI